MCVKISLINKYSIYMYSIEQCGYTDYHNMLKLYLSLPSLKIIKKNKASLDFTNRSFEHFSKKLKDCISSLRNTFQMQQTFHSVQNSIFHRTAFWWYNQGGMIFYRLENTEKLFYGDAKMDRATHWQRLGENLQSSRDKQVKPS